MAFLKAPPQKQQPLGSKKCWAYALSSWMDVTKKRNPTAPEDIVKACKNYLSLGGGLSPVHFHKVLESPFIRMAWKVLDGTHFQYAEIRSLIDTGGYIYVILQPKDDPTLSHARLIYGLTSPSFDPTSVRVVDPMMPIQIWSLAEMASFKLILGFAMELLSDDDGGLPVGMGPPSKDRWRPWNVLVGGKAVFRYTPLPPEGTLIDGEPAW